jgi:hypothetical protein
MIGVLGLLLVGLTLCGCLEQYQTTRIPSGSLSNFLLHLQASELDDARTYFAPGLVTPSANLDQSLQDASRRLQRYDIRKKKYQQEDLGNGQIRETVSGQVRPTTLAGQPTPAPEEGWQDADILTARMVVRGPGWRILDFELKCCPTSK